MITPCTVSPLRHIKDGKFSQCNHARSFDGNRKWATYKRSVCTAPYTNRAGIIGKTNKTMVFLNFKEKIPVAKML